MHLRLFLSRNYDVWSMKISDRNFMASLQGLNVPARHFERFFSWKFHFSCSKPQNSCSKRHNLFHRIVNTCSKRHNSCSGLTPGREPDFRKKWQHEFYKPHYNDMK